MGRVLRPALLALAAAAQLAGIGQAQAATLYHCSPFGDGYTYACTTVTGAPNGVRVLDRVTNEVVTWYDGTTVALTSWALDTQDPGKCGVNGDQYVWAVEWQADGYRHFGVIGDWYLNTGPVSTWNGFTDSWGHLGGDNHDSGSASGTCDGFTPNPRGWVMPWD